MPVTDVIAVDFGTANSYFCKCPADQVSPVGVDFGDGRDGLATAILYRDGKPPLVGNEALEEFGEATAEDRRGYRLRMHFKPDIAKSEEAQQCAVDFLGAILKGAESQHLDLRPEGRHVIFGIPSEADDEFRAALQNLTAEAGFGSVEVIDEPKGALFYHVEHKDIPAEQALKGILAIDFGGGTCDFSFLLRGEVRHSWGDMELGGRLFDDLFFQWFLDENPGTLDAIRAEGREYFVHSYLCREVKEYFSRQMARDRSESLNKAVRHYGRIPGMTWAKFVERASRYVPSKTFREYLESVAAFSDKLRSANPDKPIDLIEWFRGALLDGIRAQGVDKSDLRWVVLAGGSSQWPFVAGIVLPTASCAATGPMRLFPKACRPSRRCEAASRAHSTRSMKNFPASSRPRFDP